MPKMNQPQVTQVSPAAQAKLPAPVASALSEYEQEQLAELREWRVADIGWGTRLLAKPGEQVAKAVQALIPVEALRTGMKLANRAALRLADEKSMRRRAGVVDLSELRHGTLEACDALAAHVQRRATSMGAASGVAFGVAGTAGLAIDVPTLITLALRTIHRTTLCYGEPQHKDGRLGLGIFALASANSMDEKRAALDALGDLARGPLDAAWREGVERATERELAKEAAAFSLQTLAQRIGVQLGKRKAAGVVPVLGALVGGSVNAWYLWDIARVARYVCQERWLRERHPDAVTATD